MNNQGHTKEVQLLIGISLGYFIKLSFYTFLLLFTLLGCSVSQHNSKYKNKVKKYSSLEKALKEPDSVLYLTLTNKNLSYLDPEIKKLTKLRILNLNSNPLYKVPDEIFEFDSLLVLSMANCNLGFIPQKIEKLQDLIFLDLSRNDLSDLPEGIGNLYELRWLDITENNIMGKNWFRIKCLVNDSCSILFHHQYLVKPPHNCD